MLRRLHLLRRPAASLLASSRASSSLAAEREVIRGIPDDSDLIGRWMANPLLVE